MSVGGFFLLLVVIVIVVAVAAYFATSGGWLSLRRSSPKRNKLERPHDHGDESRPRHTVVEESQKAEDPRRGRPSEEARGDGYG
jgi:hypothetical protein